MGRPGERHDRRKANYGLGLMAGSIIVHKGNRNSDGAHVEPQVKTLRPQVDLSLFTASETDKEKNQETRKLTFVYFKGLIRRPQSKCRALFDQIGFRGYKARDILFLSNDFLQILTYENCVDDLIEKVKTLFQQAIKQASRKLCSRILCFPEFGFQQLRLPEISFDISAQLKMASIFAYELKK